MCCLCCRSDPQCARATHSSPAMAALTVQALHSPAVCAMQPVTLGMWVHLLLLARQTGLTVLWREHAVSLVRTKSATCVPLSCFDADLTQVSRVQSGQCRRYIVCHPTGIIHMASNPFNHALSQLCAWQTCDCDSHDHGTNILILACAFDAGFAYRVHRQPCAAQQRQLRLPQPCTPWQCV